MVAVHRRAPGEQCAPGGSVATPVKKINLHSLSKIINYSDNKIITETLHCSPQLFVLPHILELAQTTPTINKDCSL